MLAFDTFKFTNSSMMLDVLVRWMRFIGYITEVIAKKDSVVDVSKLAASISSKDTTLFTLLRAFLCRFEKVVSMDNAVMSNFGAKVVEALFVPLNLLREMRFRTPPPSMSSG